MPGQVASKKSNVPAARTQRRWLMPFQDLENMIERFWSENGDGNGTQLLAPPLDMVESDDAISLRMDLPGIDAKDIDIQVSGNQITISGERKEENEEQSETYHRIERRTGRFARAVMLPCAVQEDKVEARYLDGVLRVTLPKTAEATSRHIVVKT